MQRLVVTRHQGLVDWLLLHNHIDPDTRVVAHATEADVVGAQVVGPLPMHLAAIAKQVWNVDLPHLPAEMRGKELTPQQMDDYGARLVGYKVMPIDTWNDIIQETGVNYY